MIRVIIDTNLWISFLISKQLGRADFLFERDDIIFLFSQESLEEFVEVARRPKLRKYFPIEKIGELFDLIAEIGEIVAVSAVVNVCRDPKDNFLLALSHDGNADYLVTGDNDLLEIKRFGDTEILTFSEFELGFLIKTR